MTQRDHEKMTRMTTKFGIDPEPANHILDMVAAGMQDEDPEQEIPCCCCGNFHKAKNIDVWGICDWCRH